MGSWLTIMVSEPLTMIVRDRKSTRLNSSHQIISYAVFCLKKKKTTKATGSKSPNPLSDLRLHMGVALCPPAQLHAHARSPALPEQPSPLPTIQSTALSRHD